MPSEMRAFFMLTYKVTSQATGRYYIGSAKTYCHYMNRVGNHHIRKSSSEFHLALQANPKDFMWEVLREDELETRDYEYELLQEHVGNPLCYNKSATNGAVRGVAQRGTGWEHSDTTKLKMSESAKKPEAQPAHKKAAQSRAVSETNAKKQPCPQCGMLMNVGNLTKHLKGTRCPGNL
jgi:hypothetical protein